MPELPEVETIARELQESLVGSKIKKAEIFWERTIAAPDVATFCQQIAEQQILKVDRRAKFIQLSLTDFTLLVHLRMTGKFLFIKDEQHPHERVRLYLDDGRILSYEDQRKFGKWYLLKDPAAHLSALGVEPLTKAFTVKFLQNLVTNYRRPIKPFLLDQRYIVGLGNIYVDEALWQSKIHPLRNVSSLRRQEVVSLHAAIQNVLQRGIQNTGTSLGSHRANYFSVSGRKGTQQHQLKVFRREGHPCPRCQAMIIKIKVAQRGTHICPHCQKI